TAIPINTIAQEIENGIHFIKSQPQESHVIVSAGKSGVTQLFKNDTAIPDAGDFSGTTLYSIDTSAKQVRFSQAPDSSVVVTTGKESLIWSGDEMRVAAFFTSESAVTDDAINPRDYTRQVNNNLSTADEVAIIGGGNDDETVLLLHFDGVDGSTTFTDSSDSAHTVSGLTNAQLDTDQFKFGVSEVSINGTSSLTVPDHADWFFDSGAFTIETWIRLDEVGFITHPIYQQRADGNNYSFLTYTTAISPNKFQFVLIDASTTRINLNAQITLSPDIWYHVALIRGWGGSTDTWAITVNGQLINTATYSGNYINYAADIFIGEFNNSSYLDGWLDELRITKGIARWTSDFNPPARPYSAPANNWVVFTNRPISGISHYVDNTNGLSGQTVTYQGWNGASWTGVSTLGTSADPTNGLSQSGKISWISTVDTAKQKFLDGKQFFVYQGTLSDGEATLRTVTVDAPMQPILDNWDGVDREVLTFQVVRTSGTSDFTTRVNELTLDPAFPVTAEIGGLTAAEHVIIMFEDRIQAVRLEMFGFNETATPDLSGTSVSYFNGSDYVVQSSQYDQTVQDGIPLNKTGTISWQPPNREEEFRQTLYGQSGYAYKFVWNGTLDSAASTKKTAIDVVRGIPAPLKVRPFTFAFPYKNRLMLGGYREGNQGNRIDFSKTNTSGVWNGEETSIDGLQSIFVAGNEDLTAGKQLYNQFGNRLITMGVLYKNSKMFVLIGDGPTGDDKFRILPVSDSIGCPDPCLTLVSVDIGIAAQGQPSRNMHIFLSASGPRRFEGTKPIPIHGIDSYFDPVHDNYVGTTAISNAHAWYDRTYKEYNLRVGANWFVLSLIHNKWYTKYSPTMPTVGIPVTDTRGLNYAYSGTTTGFLMRLENGTTWGQTSTGIEQIVENGDFYPETDRNGKPDPWFLTELTKLKVSYRVLSEAATLSVTHYKDSASSGTALPSINLSEGDNTYHRKT
ncbi:hypothetical protein LCGC14_1733390, partial [marine sediment metagenome]